MDNVTAFLVQPEFYGRTACVPVGKVVGLSMGASRLMQGTSEILMLRAHGF